MTDPVNPLVLGDQRTALDPSADLPAPDPGGKQSFPSDQTLPPSREPIQKCVDLSTHTVL
jgi:hypothetical protein